MTKKYKKVDLGYFRSYSWDKHPDIGLCDHISIVGDLKENGGGCEYTEDITISCHICKITFELTELIN